jgi:hypothetical protein
MIWLGAYFQALTLGHTSCPLGSIRGCPNDPKMEKTAKKTCFLVVLNHSSFCKLPNDLVNDIPPTCGPMCIFLGPFGGA